MFSKSQITGDYVHYFSKDPAINTDSSEYDHDKWVETQDDKYLPIRDGCKPVSFHFSRLSSKQRRFLLDQQAKHGVNTYAWWAIALSLYKIDPLLVDGKDEQLSRVPDGDYVRVTDEWMDRLELYGGGTLFWELVTRIQKETYADPKS